MAARTVMLAPADNGCIEWQGALEGNGYGKCGRHAGGKKYHLAHRWAWAEHFGPIPEGMLVCHTCDNPPCCNPEHLFLGTNLDNARDRAAKGRSGPRKRRRPLKLSLTQVDEMVARYNAGEKTQYELAEEYGVNQATVCYHVGRLRKFMVDNA